MLDLTIADLGPRFVQGGHAGVKVWWEVPPEEERSVFTVAWSDLVLIRPKLTWPLGVAPETEPCWKKTPMRITYVPVLHRVMYQEIIQVPEVGSLYGVDPDSLPRLTMTRKGVMLNHVFMARLASTTQTYLATLRVLKRVSRAIDVRLCDLNLVLHSMAQTKIVLVHHKGLRAVISVMPQAVD